MKHLSDKKRQALAKPLHEVFPKINNLLAAHGIKDFEIKEIALTPKANGFTCDINNGYHIETFCDHTGRCYPICVKNPPKNG